MTPDRAKKNSSGIKASAVFHRMDEPNERAFSVLVPDGWKITGGIKRIANPNQRPIEGSGEVKLYMKVCSPDEQCVVCWLPDNRFIALVHQRNGRNTPAKNVNGDNYQGMTVMSKSSPVEFARQVILPFAHPHADEIRITGVQEISSAEDIYGGLYALIFPGRDAGYHLFAGTIEYQENGVIFDERLVYVINDFKSDNSLVWGNRETWYVRAEKGKFDSMAPVFNTIVQSFRISQKWMVNELGVKQVYQGISPDRAEEIEEHGSEICRAHERYQTWMANEIFNIQAGSLFFTNPFTGNAERGSGVWKYRWENERGDLVYTEDQDYDPNLDPAMELKNYRRSLARK
jgi:hypothetical protein